MPNRIYQESDTTADDSDKTFTVPANRQWRPVTIFVDLGTTATSGNRLMRIDFGDGTNVIYRVTSAFEHIPSLQTYYCFSRSDSDSKTPSSIGGTVYDTFPKDMILLAAYTIRVYDSLVVDVAADDMTVRMMIDERIV